MSTNGLKKIKNFSSPSLNTFQCPFPFLWHSHLSILKYKSQKRGHKYIVLFLKKRLNHFLRQLGSTKSYILGDYVACAVCLFWVLSSLQTWLWLILMSHHCPGKCSHRPGGSAGWKDTGPRHLPGASSGETECYWGAAATGSAFITPNSVLTACRAVGQAPCFFLFQSLVL